MNEIKCPKCGEVFSLSDSIYNEIATQIKESELKLALENQQKELSVLHQKNLEAETGRIKAETELAAKALVDQLNTEIARLRDHKISLSTKGLGEDLEKWCADQFNANRAIKFPTATFSKDNIVSRDDSTSKGSKGDFIFRDFDADGNEIISIMFDMKHELDETKDKKKNESFFKKLDKDRVAKNCEYAVLVSTLELDSEAYNSGIVPAFYPYEKMYVVRPDHFLSIIAILRDGALNSVVYKSELARVREINFDYTEFENKLIDFQSGFRGKTKLAGAQFKIAIDQIQKAIDDLEKTKEALRLTEVHLKSATKLSDKLDVKELTARSESS